MAHRSARNPCPDAAGMDRDERRARRAFAALYGWFREHADELYPINRNVAAMT